VVRQRGEVTNCSHSCFIAGREEAETADATMYDTTWVAGPQWLVPSGQILIGSYQESPEHFKKSIENNELAHYMYGFSPYDDFIINEPLFAFGLQKDPRSFELPSWESKRQKPMLSVWITNSRMVRTDRLGYLQSLQASGITVASYGKWAHTDDPPKDTFYDANWKEFVTYEEPGHIKR
jgi:hypothetical protein